MKGEKRYQINSGFLLFPKNALKIFKTRTCEMFLLNILLHSWIVLSKGYNFTTCPYYFSSEFHSMGTLYPKLRGMILHFETPRTEYSTLKYPVRAQSTTVSSIIYL